jgi:predicted nucleic acid-binding protein
MYLLDTNVVSELRKVNTGSAHPQVKSWAKGLDAETTFLSVITLLELEQGILSLEHRDPRQGLMLRAWMENQVLPDFTGRILPVDLSVARKCATLHVPDPFSYRDSLIAATALVHGMTVVTRNAAHFERTGVKLLNPWQQ